MKAAEAREIQLRYQRGLLQAIYNRIVTEIRHPNGETFIKWETKGKMNWQVLKQLEEDGYKIKVKNKDIPDNSNIFERAKLQPELDHIYKISW